MKCKELISYCSMLFVLLTSKASCFSQTSVPELNPAQVRALALLNGSDTISISPLWPHIKPTYFFSNIRANILYPGKINQGHNTNFCSYAALTHLLIKYEPDNYTRMILSLYYTGKATLYSKKILTPSKRVRQAAGLLSDNGELNILHANQLWFLAMADNFKGYLNLFDHKYRLGMRTPFGLLPIIVNLIRWSGNLEVIMCMPSVPTW